MGKKLKKNSDLIVVLLIYRSNPTSDLSAISTWENPSTLKLIKRCVLLNRRIALTST